MKNKYLNKNKFFNTIKGRNKNFFFIFPTIIMGRKKMIRWELTTKSITFALFRYFYQINLFTVTKDSSKEIFKPDIRKVLAFLHKNDLDVTTVAELIEYIQNNNYLLTLIKNIDLDNYYAQKVMLYYFQNQDFVTRKIEEQNN